MLGSEDRKMVVKSPNLVNLESATDSRIVAVIDDSPDLAEETYYQLEEAGYQGEILSGPFSNDVDQLAQQLAQRVHAVICDHRLREGGLADFYGSQLVASLYDLKKPAILITQYLNDSHTTIGAFRRKIPVLLTRDELTPMSLKRGINQCTDELDGHIPRERRPHRTIIRVEQIDKEFGEKVIEAFVTGWKLKQAVRFPASLIPELILEKVQPGTRLFARVNVGALKPEDLFFQNFEIAPEPDEDDGLA